MGMSADRRELSIAAALSIAIVLGGATSAPLPKDVAAHVGEMDKSCEEEGGTPQPSGTWEPFEGHFKFQPRRLVEHVVLAGSSAEVWAIMKDGIGAAATALRRYSQVQEVRRFMFSSG